MVSYLRRWWPLIERRQLSGRLDRGDALNGPKGWTLECKAEKRVDLPRYLREAKAEAANNGDPWYAVIVKNRKGKFSSGTVGDAFVVMPLAQWAVYVDEREVMFDRLSALGETT